jgi:hypothetical protein
VKRSIVGEELAVMSCKRNVSSTAAWLDRPGVAAGRYASAVLGSEKYVETSDT